MNNVSKLKNLMVSSCQAIKEGNRDIAVNLLEIAADLMEEPDISPEVIETQFITTVNTEVVPTEFENASEEQVDDVIEDAQHVTTEQPKDLGNETDEAEVEQASHNSLRDILDGWSIPNVNNKSN